MAHDDATDGYAEALFAVARAEGALPAVEEELYAFAKTLERDTPLRDRRRVAHGEQAGPDR